MCDDDGAGGDGDDGGGGGVMAVVAATLAASVVFCLAIVALVFVAVAFVAVLCAMDGGIVCVVTLAAVSVADNFRSSVLAIVVAVVVVVLTIVAVVRSFCINWSTIDGDGGGGSGNAFDALKPLAIHSPNEKSAITTTATTITFIWQ